MIFVADVVGRSWADEQAGNASWDWSVWNSGQKGLSGVKRHVPGVPPTKKRLVEHTPSSSALLLFFCCSQVSRLAER